MAKDYNNSYPINTVPLTTLPWTATGNLDDGEPGDTSSGIVETYEEYTPPTTITETDGNLRVLGRAYLTPGQTAAALQSFRFTVRDTVPQIVACTLCNVTILAFSTRVTVWARPAAGATPWYTGAAPGTDEYTLLASSPVADHFPNALPDFSEDADDVPGLRLVGVRDGGGYLQCELQTTGGSGDLSGLGMSLVEIVVSIETTDHNIAYFSGDETTVEWSNRITDIRVNGEGEPCSDTGLYDLPRDEWRGFDCTGNTGPAVDEWEIWRCGELIDSGDLGGYGLGGWSIRVGVGSDYDIYAPPGAEIANGYQARIDSGTGNCSIDFNVIDRAAASCDDQRPYIRERWQFGREGDDCAPVVPNRQSIGTRLSVPNPEEPATVVQEQGSSIPADLISQKGHCTANLSGPLAFLDTVYYLSSLACRPVFVAVPGASLAYDALFLLRGKQTDPFDTWTIESGQERFPARFNGAALVAGTFTLGKAENTFEGPVIGRQLDESLTAFAGLPEAVETIPGVYVAAKDNGHYLASSLADVQQPAALLCDTQEAVLTIAQRRSPHFDQCPNEPSFSGFVAQTEETKLTLTLSHKTRSRAFVESLRSRVGLYYRYLNVGPAIEGSVSYELEMIAPVKFETRQGTQESDLVTAAGYDLRLLDRNDFDPFSTGTAGGYLAVRVRVPLSALPSASLLP